MGTFTKPAHEFADNALVKTHLIAAAREVAADAGESFKQEITDRLELGGLWNDLAFDSPLEVIFWLWWRASMKADYFCRESLTLQHQVEVSIQDQRYVLDFVIAADGPDYVMNAWPRIAVELDGHAFHEKTLEQVTSRNQRDRTLQQAGWHIFHFSFAEFTQHPQTSVFEVVDYARAAFWALVKQQSERYPAALAEGAGV